MFAYTEYQTDPRVRREAKALADRGDRVDFLCLRQPRAKGQPPAPRWEQLDGVSVCHLPFGKYQGSSQLAYLLSYVLFLFLGAWWITGLHLRRRYQLIQVHTMPDFLIFAALVPRIFGCKLILDMHDLTSDLYSVKFRSRLAAPLVWGLRAQERLSAGLAHHVITVHEPYRQILIQRGIRPDKITVLMNTPDDRIFSMAARATGKLPAAPVNGAAAFTLVYHGTVVARYGIDVMLQAIALLRQSGTIAGLQAKIYGKGDDLPRLQSISAALGLDDIVYFHGKHVPLEDLPGLLIQADLAVVPNQANAFTDYVLPTKLMEYAAIGVPAAVARTLVVSQYFDDDMVAYFTPGDARELAGAIEALARDPARRRLMARTAYEGFTQRYNWSVQKRTYYALADRLCKRTRALPSLSAGATAAPPPLSSEESRSPLSW
jgi:glycosyltransferase involved in cell wall biosynthesis